jgi:ribose transport system substrate-binding protein
MKRKILSIILMFFVISGVVVLVEGKEKYVIGFSQCTMNHPWRIAQVEWQKEYVKANLPDVKLIVTDGENRASKQVADVESLLARGVDVLLIAPLTADALTGIVKKAMDSGVPVITLDRNVNTPVTCHIGAENRPIGEYTAKWLNEKLKGHGNIIEIAGTAGASVTIERHEGFVDELKKYPGLKLIAVQYCDYLREPAMAFTEDMLQRFGPGTVDAIYAQNDEMAFGAIKALQAANRENEVIVTGVDGANIAIDAVKKGTLGLTIIYPVCAPEGVQYAYKVAKGETIPENVVLKNQPIDDSNVNNYIGKGF